MSIRTQIYIFATHVGCDVVLTSLTHQDNHLGVIEINCAQFGVSRSVVFDQFTKANSKKSLLNSIRPADPAGVARRAPISNAEVKQYRLKRPSRFHPMGSCENSNKKYMFFDEAKSL